MELLNQIRTYCHILDIHMELLRWLVPDTLYLFQQLHHVHKYVSLSSVLGHMFSEWYILPIRPIVAKLKWEHKFNKRNHA